MRIFKASVVAFWLVAGVWLGVPNANVIKTLGDVTPSATPSICVPADGAEAYVILTNSGANDCRVGDAATAVAQGVNVKSAGSITITTQAAIWCYSASGTTINILKVMK